MTESIEKQIESGLQILNKRESELLALAEESKGLTINGPEDKAGYKAVREQRIKLKNARTKLENDAYDLRENAIKFQKTVIAREKQLKAIIAPAESELSNKEEQYDEAIEQIRIEKERKENERIQGRVNALAKFGYAMDMYEAKIMPEENFQALLGHAEAEYIKEQERIAAEKAEQERIRKQEEEQMRIEREELARQRTEQEARERELQRQEQERIEAARKKEAAMRAEQEKLAAERKAFEEQKAKEAAEKKRLEELEQARLKAIEDEKERLKREAEQKAEAEHLAKIEAERKEALKPDKEKLLSFSKSLYEIPAIELKDKKAKDIFSQARTKLDEVSLWIKNQTDNL